MTRKLSRCHLWYCSESRNTPISDGFAHETLQLHVSSPTGFLTFQIVNLWGVWQYSSVPLCCVHLQKGSAAFPTPVRCSLPVSAVKCQNAGKISFLHLTKYAIVAEIGRVTSKRCQSVKYWCLGPNKVNHDFQKYTFISFLVFGAIQNGHDCLHTWTVLEERAAVLVEDVEAAEMSSVHAHTDRHALLRTGEPLGKNRGNNSR